MGLRYILDRPSSVSSLKLTCYIESYPHSIPTNSYLPVNNVDLVKQIPLSLISASQYFFPLSTGEK